MFTVAVLMSTYNGENYLRQQIESILYQKNVEVHLFVRDDGSSDHTLDILREYQTKGLLTLKEGKNCGVGNSFMKLLYEAPDTYDFYAFSDQDDIWLPDKLIRATDMMWGEKFPVLYAGNQTLVDSEGRWLGMRYQASPSVDYHQILCSNQISGCTMVFNRKLFLLLKEETRRPSEGLLHNRIHDVWVAMVAAVSGLIVFDMNSYILYRQHDHNVVGARKRGFMDRIRELLEKIREPEKRRGRSWLAEEILKGFGEFVNEEKNDLILYASYRNAIVKKMKLLKDSTIRQYSHETVPGYVLKVWFGLF